MTTIFHDGLALHPLTPEVVASHPELDPWQRDEGILRRGADAGWVDLEGRRQPPKLIRRACRPGDALYYWDGPWGVLSGSSGIAVVRDGRVVETFTVMVS